VDALHRWTDRQGVEWVCGAYDHGPFCRLCQQVDATIIALLDNVDQGRMTFEGVDRDGQLLFRLTDEGRRQALALMGSN
jgi:hypothetical protein